MWKTRWSKIGVKTSETLGDLKVTMSKEIKGLSEDARMRISKILNEAASSAGKISNDGTKQLA